MGGGVGVDHLGLLGQLGLLAYCMRGEVWHL